MAEPTRFDRVLAILADGARWDVLERLALAGEMPNLRQHFVECGGCGPRLRCFPRSAARRICLLLSGLHRGAPTFPVFAGPSAPWVGAAVFFFARVVHGTLALGQTGTRHPSDCAHAFSPRTRPGRREHLVRARLPVTRAHDPFFQGRELCQALATTDWYASNLQAEAAVGRAWQRGFPSVYAVFPAIDELGHRFGPLTEQSYEAYAALMPAWVG